VNTDDETLMQEAGKEALAPGSKLLSGQYEIQRYLSSGGFGITYLATDSLNRTVVIKECFPEAFCNRVNKTVRARTHNYIEDFQSTVRLFIKEAHALSRLDHPSVVGVHQVFEDNETAYMALDLIDGQDLLGIIESGAPQMSPEAVRSLTLKLLDAIDHVHGQDLLHRDISPDNILVDKSGHPVLIDFGAAREEASRKSRILSSVLVVKDGYSPQEFYIAGSQQQPCSDLYALAATLSHLITGEAPPNSQVRVAALAANQPDPYQRLTGRFPQYDAAFLEAIDKALNIAPSKRMQSAEEWTLAIDHSKRLELARAKAQKDKSIDVTVMNLIKSANAEVHQVPERKETGGHRPLAQSLKKASPSVENVQCGTSDAEGVTRVSENARPVCGEIEEATPCVAPETVPVSSEVRPSPYVRVTSRALEAAKRKELATSRLPCPNRMSRFATVPVVFCAYFFYAHLLFQYEEVHAATIQPLVALSGELASFREYSAKTVSIIRGIDG
jgi:serine/threonine protein kinase